MQTYQTQTKLKLVSTVVSLLVIGGVITVADHLKPKISGIASSQVGSGSAVAPAQASTSSSATTAPTASSAQSASGSGSATSSGFKDGTYSASASYYVPPGYEKIDVTLSLNSGVITNISIRNSEGDPTSASYQEEFASMYKSSVVGKKISNLQLSVIGGASDTTQGFADALSQIASQAQA